MSNSQRKKGKNLTLDPDLIELAEKLMKRSRFKKMTPYIEQLIREEWERRKGEVCEDEAPKKRLPNAA